MKKITPQDQVEKELLAAMESFEDEHLGTAEEDFPKAFRDMTIKRNTSYKRDDNWDYVLDDNGNKIKEVDKKEIAKVLKEWASYFARHGVSIEHLNFDDYLLQGVSLDKYPKDCLTVVQYQDDFIVCDTRKDYKGKYDGSLWQAHSIKMVRGRDGKYVDLVRIPDGQILSGATNIWVIPAQDIMDPSDLIKKREESRKGIPIRKTPEQISKMWSDRERRSYDKSGYYIDRNAMKRRLDDYKASKLEREGSSQKVKDLLLAAVDFYNSIISEVTGILSTAFSKLSRANGASLVNEVREFFGYAEYANRYFTEAESTIEYYDDNEKRLKEQGRNSSENYYRKELAQTKDKLIKAQNGDSFMEDLVKSKERIMSLIKGFEEASTENLRGQSSSVQGNIGEHYVSPDIMEALESDEADWFNRNGDYADDED